ncbi:MAG: hypothetical protein U0103_04080 [Candidatus Obscuribacterales bacterium]
MIIRERDPDVVVTSPQTDSTAAYVVLAVVLLSIVGFAIWYFSSDQQCYNDDVSTASHTDIYNDNQSSASSSAGFGARSADGPATGTIDTSDSGSGTDSSAKPGCAACFTRCLFGSVSVFDTCNPSDACIFDN